MGIAHATRRSRVHPGWHVLGAALVLSWVAVLAVMFWPGEGGAEIVSIDSAKAADMFVAGEDWMGAFAGGRRIGMVHAITRREESGIRIDQESRLNLTLAGLRQPISSRLELLLRDDFRLKTFKFHLDAGPLSVTSEGRMEGDRLTVEVDLGTEKMKHSILLTEPPLFDVSIPRLLSRQDLQPGKRYRITVFDPQTLSNQPTVVEVLGVEALKTEGNLLPAFHLRRQLVDTTLDTWIDDHGRVLQEESSLGLLLRREDAHSAKSADTETEALPEEELRRLLQQFLPLPASPTKVP